MHARKGAAARLSRVGIVALALGVGTFAVLEIRGRATAQLSKDPGNRPSLIVTPDREFAASSYVHDQLRPNVPRDAHSDAWVADLQRRLHGFPWDKLEAGDASGVSRDLRKYRRGMREPSIDTLSPPSTQEFV
jgi:hypothetical protein